MLNIIYSLDGISNQTIPIVLPVTEKDKKIIAGSRALSLAYDGKIVAILRDPEFFPHRKDERCCRQWGVFSKQHPYVKVRVMVPCVIESFIWHG